MMRPSSASRKPKTSVVADSKITKKADSALDKQQTQKIESEFGSIMLERSKFIADKCQRLRKTLDLSSSNIDDLDALTISLSLNDQPGKLEVVNFSTNSLTDEGLISILSALQWHPNLRELHLGDNDLSVVGMMALADVIGIFKNLEALSLENCGLTDECIVPLAYSLGELKSLKTLRLSGNKISDEALISLSILISLDQLSCANLYLGNNTFTAKGLRPFFKSFEMNTTIKTLYLNNIPMDPTSLKAACKGLMNNESLTELSLSECKIGDECIDNIRNMLVFNSRLKRVDLSRNKLTDKGGAEILDVIENHNQTLESIVLRENPIDNKEIVEDIDLYLSQNSKFDSGVEKKTSQPGSKPYVMEDSDSDYEEEEQQHEGEEINQNEEEGEDDEENDEKELEELEREIEAHKIEYQHEIFANKGNDIVADSGNHKLEVPIEEEIEEDEETHKTRVWQGFKSNESELLKSKFK